MTAAVSQEGQLSLPTTLRCIWPVVAYLFVPLAVYITGVCAVSCRSPTHTTLSLKEGLLSFTWSMGMDSWLYIYNVLLVSFLVRLLASSLCYFLLFSLFD
eukprot:scpid22362/ scgid10574/ 